MKILETLAQKAEELFQQAAPADQGILQVEGEIFNKVMTVLPPDQTGEADFPEPKGKLSNPNLATTKNIIPVKKHV